MDTLKKHLKPWDIVIIIVVTVASFTPLVVFAGINSFSQSRNEDVIANVKIDGKIVDTFNLSTTNKSFEKTYYPAKGQYNIIEVAFGKIRVKEDNSPDQIAVHTGWISQPGQTSICLPHKLVLEIEGKDEHPLIY